MKFEHFALFSYFIKIVKNKIINFFYFIIILKFIKNNYNIYKFFILWNVKEMEVVLYSVVAIVLKTVYANVIQIV
jgi:hypothetical protein